METIIPHEWRRHFYVTSKVSREHAPACSPRVQHIGPKALALWHWVSSTVVDSYTGLFHILLKTLYVSWTYPNPNRKLGVGDFTDQSVQTTNY